MYSPLPLSSLSFARDNEDGRDIKHVLLITWTAMHALDLTNYVAAHPGSTLRNSAIHGIHCTRTHLRHMSLIHSRPGCADYGRSPTTTGFGMTSVSTVSCLPRPNHGTGSREAPTFARPRGAALGYDEGVDFDLSRLDAGGGITRRFCLAIQTMAASLFSAPSTYALIQFNVARERPLHCWIDKHPSYEWVNGSSNHGTMTSLDRGQLCVVPLTTAPF